MAESIYRKASLAMIPYGAKEDELPSIKPTDGSGDFTFSRGSDIEATRVNSSGLIEKAKTNYVLQSNTFNTTWLPTDATITSGATDPNGGSTAWTLANTAANGIIQQSVSLTGLRSVSIYAKQGTHRYLRLGAYGGTQSYANFDLQDGVVSSGTKAVIESVGGGWYRCTAWGADGTTGGVQIYASNNATSAPTTNGNILIWRAQLNHGLIAQDYVETTTTAVVEGLTADLPRLDYSGGASCPSLLLEPSRANISVHSEFFGGWTTIGTATFTANYGASPEGVQNAYRFEATSAARGGKFIPISVSSGTTYTLSFYAKSLSGTQKIRIGADNGCSTPQDAETFEIGTEWLRIDKTITSDQTSWNLFFDNVESGTACTGTYLDVDMLIYGFQCEAGSYPTSYIPTYGTAANRGNEYFDTSVDLQTSGILGSTWTFLYDNTFVDVPRDDTSSLFLIQDTSGNSARVSLNTDGSFRLQISRVGSIANVSANKIIGRYDGSSVEFFADGVSVGSASALPNEFANLNQYAPTARTAKQIKLNQVLIFPTALTDAECIALTTI